MRAGHTDMSRSRSRHDAGQVQAQDKGAAVNRKASGLEVDGCTSTAPREAPATLVRYGSTRLAAKPSREKRGTASCWPVVPVAIRRATWRPIGRAAAGSIVEPPHDRSLRTAG